MERIRVMLVEDDSFWRDHISGDLADEPDIQVAGVAATKEEAIELASKQDLDVILMDINLTGNNLDGLDAAEQILHQERNRSVKIIMLTSITEAEVIMKSFRLGAMNYINKSSYRDILNAIREANSGRASIHPDAARAMRSEVQLMELSPTEREVFELRRSGMSKREISERLHKSTNTIKTQLRSIKNKLTHFKMD
ncbi:MULTISPECIES: response regulator transcription factor [Paenibacillus]|uniref:DNA-binding response regulator n=1 Tax=Paenibacillus vini TaxID=1476024 RepID=A0ABQ4MEW8_9BACL|nr:MULTISPECIES: response regulator transcription factor [Paenibacillus]MBQ4901046.1 response regulator transcription factor [Paenibacillus sp. Marseille-P2973]MDN4068230.1 response regulator transcription factor [Paenibacillus vini]GIP54502.1 DNA-binding response regulator [Paenibacillus vini]